MSVPLEVDTATAVFCVDDMALAQQGSANAASDKLTSPPANVFPIFMRNLQVRIWASHGPLTKDEKDRVVSQTAALKSAPAHYSTHTLRMRGIPARTSIIYLLDGARLLPSLAISRDGCAAWR